MRFIHYSLRAASFFPLALWCSTVTVFPQNAPSSGLLP